MYPETLLGCPNYLKHFSQLLLIQTLKATLPWNYSLTVDGDSRASTLRVLFLFMKSIKIKFCFLELRSFLEKSLFAKLLCLIRGFVIIKRIKKKRRKIIKEACFVYVIVKAKILIEILFAVASQPLLATLTIIFYPIRALIFQKLLSITFCCKTFRTGIRKIQKIQMIVYNISLNWTDYCVQNGLSYFILVKNQHSHTDYRLKIEPYIFGSDLR